jgi:ribonuclease HI
MILPQMLYRCSAWYRTRPHRPSGKPYMNKSRMTHLLAPIQRRAAQIITGAFRTTAANAVEIEAYLAPLDQQIEKTSLHATLRIASSPLYKSFESDQKDSKKSPLYHHTKILRTHYKISHASLERRHPYIITPWWKPPLVTIDSTPEEAIAHHQDICSTGNTNCIYTDGSGINGHVGAAAVTLLTPTSPGSPTLQRRIFYMGRDTESTVYAAELQGIYLALQILEARPEPQLRKATIFTDNQSALRTVHKPGNTSGQYILRKLLLLLQKVTAMGMEVELRWIPAHKGVPGNEAADLAAKQAAEEGMVPQESHQVQSQSRNRNQDQDNRRARGIRTLLTTAKRVINEGLQDDWETIWKQGKHGRFLHSLDAGPNRKVLKMHQNLARPISSIITQMRTGKIGLRAYLHSINKVDTSECTCGHGDQTVEHILLKCREWTAERHDLWAGGRPILNLKGLLGDPKMAIRAAKMMLKTGLLEQFREVSIPTTT